jgi:hypothetical protein
MEFHVPFEEFTICKARDQTTIVLYQRMPRQFGERIDRAGNEMDEKQ